MVLTDMISKHKGGEAIGVTSICSSHPFVLRTAIANAVKNDQILLVESTCNQVNQFGGYSGKKPADFATDIKTLANDRQLPLERLILGGDHLGPNPWISEPALKAMGKAKKLVADYVSAGYTKIHLDASLMCIDDNQGDPDFPRIIAQRTAELCYVAEKKSEELGNLAPKPLYVIGSEVPLAGGALIDEEEIDVTSAEDVQFTIELTRQSFEDKGLHAAWDRVIAVVVHPGVEFSGNSIRAYDTRRTQELTTFIESDESLVYEAHSTDYQTRQALRQLVKDHFAILKVGPALTYAYREAIFSLEMINNSFVELNRKTKLSNIQGTLDDLMISRPDYWQSYYTGDDSKQRFDRMYSLSDRARYYWSHPSLVKAVDQLFASLSSINIPLSVISQFMPEQYRNIRQELLENDAWSLVSDKIASILTDYDYACGIK